MTRNAESAARKSKPDAGDEASSHPAEDDPPDLPKVPFIWNPIGKYHFPILNRVAPLQMEPDWKIGFHKMGTAP